MIAAALAAAAGIAAVLAAHDALAAMQASGAASTAGERLAPLLRLGRDGRAPSAPERRRLGLLATATLLAGGTLISGPLLGLALAAAGPSATAALLRARRARHRNAVAAGAPLVARALSDALAGGHSVHGAALAAAHGGGVPGAAGSELRATAAALELGVPVDAALESLRVRADVPAIDTIVAAIAVQRTAGGDLARLLRDIAGTQDEASRLEAEARTATAQARFTGLLVAGLPAGAAALAELGSPGYVTGLLQSPLTAWLAGCAAALQIAALVVIKRLERPPR